MLIRKVHHVAYRCIEAKHTAWMHDRSARE